MPKILRKLQKEFGSTGPSTAFGQFGSLAAGSILTTKDPDAIQALPEYLQGWLSAVVGGNSPAIEDMNALCYLFSYQIAYQMQSGIPEWNSGTDYYIGSLVNDGNGVIFVSLTDDNNNNALTDSLNWKKMIADKPGCINIVNSDFEKDVAGWTFTDGLLGSGGSLVRSTTLPLTGTASALVTTTATGLDADESNILNYDKTEALFFTLNRTELGRRTKVDFDLEFINSQQGVAHSISFPNLYDSFKVAVLDSTDTVLDIVTIFKKKSGLVALTNPTDNEVALEGKNYKSSVVFDLTSNTDTNLKFCIFNLVVDPDSDKVANTTYKFDNVKIKTLEDKTVGTQIEGVLRGYPNWGITNSLASGVWEDFACNNIDEDEHGQWSYGGSSPNREGQFTAKGKMVCSVNFKSSYDPASFSQGNAVQLSYEVNGSLKEIVGTRFIPYTSGSFPATVEGSFEVLLDKGDVLKLKTFQNSGSNKRLDTDPGLETKSWMKIHYKSV